MQTLKIWQSSSLTLFNYIPNPTTIQLYLVNDYVIVSFIDLKIKI